MIRLLLKILLVVIAVGALFIAFTLREAPTYASYGVTFSNFHAEELGLDWKETYRALLDDLGVRKLRVPAYWPDVEPERDIYDFSILDYEIREAKARDAEVILAIGRRLPRWPECHIPHWVGNMEWEEQQMEITQYLTKVVERYHGNPTVVMWQVENEPYLNAFANEFCGDLDEAFLIKEIALVKSLDPDRPILVTDSGNLGLWMGPYKNGDAFGTSLYMYFWNPELGQFKTKLPAMVYRMKTRLMEMLYGTKPTFLIELSLEPWLPEPTVNAPIDTQLSRMDTDKFDEIILYARKTSFDTQYLWGAEWWYYMKEKGHSEFWDKAKTLYAE